MNTTTCTTVKVLEMTRLGQSGIGADFFELEIEYPGWEQWRPGQFVMVRPASWGFEHVWARPFSICSVDNDRLTVFFQVVGRGTAKLAELNPGDQVTVWGPLGNGFAVQKRKTLLLAGGVGLAPFRGYIESHPRPQDLYLVFAHRMAIECYPFKKMTRLVGGECIQEEKPSDINRIIGLVRDRVREFSDGLVLACGPEPFMRTVQEAALEVEARCQLSLENRMACGVGGCLGCVTGNADGTNRRVCVEGPVVWAKDVVLGDFKPQQGSPKEG